MMPLLRATSLLLFFTLVGFGLLVGGDAGDARWLALLGTGWLLLLVAFWPSLPGSLPTFNRTAIRTAFLLATVFAILSVQLVRIQVVRSEATVTRRALDPVTGDAVANPRLIETDLDVERGRVFDRNGSVLADSVREGDVFRRVYPEPESAYVVGYYSPLLYGREGLEASYDAELRGEEGTNALVRWRNDLLHQPQEGLDLHLTLDATLQRTAHELLADRAGAAVLVDVETGAVLVLASNPHYDPNRLATVSFAEGDAARDYWQTLTDDPTSPLLLRATDASFTPGSTFKVVSAAAVIDAGFASPETEYEDDGSFEIDGRVIPENENRPDDSTVWTLREGLAWSLNVVFAQVGLALGPTVLRDYGDRFGFGEEIPFDLPVVESQLASDDAFLNERPALAETAFGQGQLLASPLHMAMVAQCVANGGRMMQPYLVDHLRNDDGDVVRRSEPAVWREAISPEAAAQVEEMMVGAVEQGVATGAAIEGLRVGGKTGTAELGEGQEPHAWFIGFAGDPEPRYAVAVILEHGGAGMAGSLAIGRELLAAAMAGAP